MADIEPLWDIYDIAKLYGVRKSQAHAIVATPSFPRPVTDGKRCRKWSPDAVRDYIAGRSKGTLRRAS